MPGVLQRCERRRLGEVVQMAERLATINERIPDDRRDMDVEWDVVDLVGRNSPASFEESNVVGDVLENVNDEKKVVKAPFLLQWVISKKLNTNIPASQVDRVPGDVVTDEIAFRQKPVERAKNSTGSAADFCDGIRLEIISRDDFRDVRGFPRRILYVPARMVGEVLPVRVAVDHAIQSIPRSKGGGHGGVSHRCPLQAAGPRVRDRTEGTLHPKRLTHAVQIHTGSRHARQSNQINS